MQYPSDAHPRIKRGKQSPADALEHLGIRAWSLALDVSPETALATVASVLTGIAGPAACLESTWGSEPLPKLDLLTCRSDVNVQRQIDCLADPVLQLNRRLCQKMAVHNPEALEICMTGTTGGKHTPAGLAEKTMTQHWQALTLTADAGSLLDVDLAYDPVPNRLEAIKYPEFVLENPRSRDLPSLIDQCHLHTALVIRPVLPQIRKGSELHQMMTQLAALLKGTIVGKRQRISCQPAKACAILALSEPEIEFVQASGSDLMAGLLWLVGGTAADIPADPEASRKFFQTYRQALTLILDTRRIGRAPAFVWQSDRARAEFETELGKYRHELGQMQVDPGSSAHALPQSLLWAMGFLRLAMNGRMSDESMVETAFSCALRLVKTHVGELTEKDDVRKVNARCVFAERIVTRISREPHKFRDLVRTFNKQHKADFMPVLNALIELGVLSRDAQKVYHLGAVELSEVMDELLAKLEASDQDTEAAENQAVRPDNRPDR